MTVNKVDAKEELFAFFANFAVELFIAKNAKEHRKGRKERQDNSLPG